MPKNIYKIDKFDAGLVTHQNIRDIPDEALSIAENIMVDVKGKIRLMGVAEPHPDFDTLDLDKPIINPGYGLYALNHDYSFIHYRAIQNINSTAVPNGTGYTSIVDCDGVHGLRTGAIVRIVEAEATGADGEYVIEYEGTTDAFKIFSTININDPDGTAGFIVSARGNFRSLFTDINGQIAIYPEFGEVITSWNQGDNQACTLALGANLGGSHSSGDDDPANWTTARLNYGYYNGALRISNANYGDLRELGNLDKYDWPTWIGYVDDKFFTGVDGASIVGTVTWRPQWYQTIAHPMSPLEWNSFRKFENRHNDFSTPTWVNDNRAIECPVYCFPVTTASELESTEAKVKAFEYDTDININTTSLVPSMTILPGQFMLRLYTNSTSTYAEQGDWDAKAIYKFGYSYYYDDDGVRGQDSEIHQMGTWNVREENTGNHYYHDQPSDGALVMGTTSSTDSEGTRQDMGCGAHSSVDMQVFINTGGDYNFTNSEGAGTKVMRTYWPPRMRGIRIWLVGEVDVATSAGSVIAEPDPKCVMEIDFLKGVRLNATGEYTKYKQLSGETSPATPLLEPNGSSYAEEDFMVYHSTLTSKELPIISYSQLNGGVIQGRPFNAVRWKTDTILNNIHYIGNVEADYGLTGFPHNVFDDDKRKLTRFSDSVFRSIPFKPDSFSPNSIMTVGEENDGEEIVKIDSVGSQLLVWKTNTLFIYDSSEGQDILTNTYEHMGLLHPHAVVKVEKGIAWINPNGLFMYDGEQMGNATSGKIDPQEWKDFIGENGTLGYIPMNKQIVIFESGVGSRISGSVYIFDIQTDSFTRGSGVVPELTKSNPVNNYDKSLIFASPKVDGGNEFHSLATVEASESFSGAYGAWRVRGLGPAMTFTNTKLTIGSTDITNTFSALFQDDPIDQIIRQINNKCGIGTFQFIRDIENGVLDIIWPVGNAGNASFNGTTLAGLLTITNPPVSGLNNNGTHSLDSSLSEIVTSNLCFVDADELAQTNHLGLLQVTNSNGNILNVSHGRFIGMVAPSGMTNEQYPPVSLPLLQLFDKFKISEFSGLSVIDDAIEGTYDITDTVSTTTAGGEQHYAAYHDPLTISIGGQTFQAVNTGGPNNQSMNDAATTHGQFIRSVITLPVFTMEALAGGSPYAYMYLSFAQYGAFFYPGVKFKISGSINHDNSLAYMVHAVEFIGFENRQIAKLLISLQTNFDNPSGTIEEGHSGLSNDISIIFDNLDNDFSGSNIGVETVSIPSVGSGKEFFIVPDRSLDAAADDVVTYFVNVSGNDGKSYQFAHTRADNESSFKTMKSLKSQMETANLGSGETAWSQNGFEDTSKFIFPTKSIVVTFDGTANTIQDNTKSLRAYESLLNIGAEFSLTNCATADNDKTFIVAGFEQTDSYDKITINTSPDNLGGSSDPSAIGTTITNSDPDDTVTFLFHALFMAETDDREYDLEVNSGVYDGAQMYDFHNSTSKVNINIPNFATKDIDLGAPGVKKNIIKIYLTCKNASDLEVKYQLNGSKQFYHMRPSRGTQNFISNSISDSFETFEMVPERAALRNTRDGVYSIRFFVKTRVPVSNFELNDISVVYRSIGVR